MSTYEIKLLQSYRVDRQAGATANGPEQLVVLVLKVPDTHEFAVAISKVDAMILAHRLMSAAHDAQDA